MSTTRGCLDDALPVMLPLKVLVMSAKTTRAGPPVHSSRAQGKFAEHTYVESEQGRENT